MKRHYWYPLVILFFSFQYISAQGFSEVDAHARNTPSSKTNDISKLAKHLTQDFSTEKEKVRAIYVWMSENIKYSTATLSSQRLTVEQRLKKQEPERVLRSKKAICEGYSNLFIALCDASDLKAFTVTGYTKLPNGKIAPVGHAWNMVKVDGKWELMDVTWGAGGIDRSNGKYVKSMSEDFFCADPLDFIQHHLPHDPLFQVLEEPVSYTYFQATAEIKTDGDAFSEKINRDLDEYYGMGVEERLLASSRRAVEFDPNNGFANFTLSKHHYELALVHYQVFFDDSQKAFSQKLPLTTSMVDAWEKSLSDYKTELKKSEAYLSGIRSGDPVSGAVKTSKSAIRQAWKISGETDRQLKEYRKYLARVGH